MKILIRPRFEGPDKGEGGIRRWVDALCHYLPDEGIEVVERESEADLVACHAGDIVNTSKPLVAHNHGLYNTADQEWSRWAWMLNANVIELMRRAQLVTVPSQWVAAHVARGMNIRAHVLYAGVEPSQWEPAEDGGYILWNKTRPDPVCDPEPMNKLAALNPKLPFVSTFGQKAANVTITGKVGFEEAREFTQRAMVYLSTTRETFGIGTAEALCAGVPVLGWAWGGNEDIVRHLETGYLAKPGDYQDLQQGLEYVITHRDRLGQAGRADVLERFTMRRGVAEAAQLYRDVLHRRESADHPTVSVIVTCYKLEEYLPECLDSLLAQTFQDWDCWIVDDCSPGNCETIVTDYRQRDKRFHYVRTPRNLYLAGARNHGIGQTPARYILALDADDMLNPRALEVLAGHLDKQPGHAIAYSAMEVLEPDGRRWVSGWPGQFSYASQITHKNQLPYASMFRREVWERIGGYRERCQTAEDADFWCRATSFGARPYKASSYPFLVKRQRKESMGHVESEPDWTAWYPWSRKKALVPWGCAGDPPAGSSWPVQLYDPPRVSVIIPVGPGHDTLLGDALDSIQAQTEPSWECIVANDTGQPLDLAGWPWVRVLPTPAPGSGPAVARNMAIAAARAPLIACLDGDDYYMPGFLERCLDVQEEHGGYVYTDWFQVGSDGASETKRAPEFEVMDLLQSGLLFTVNSVFPKAAWQKAGGFDPSCKSWEDWDFFFALATLGICGTHLPEPLFVYRYWSGQRREDGYAEKEANARHLRKKWSLWTKNGGKKLMGECRNCPGGGGAKAGANPARIAGASPQVMGAAQGSGMVRMEYSGPAAGDRVYKGPKTGQLYTFGNNQSRRRGFVWEADAEIMKGWAGFAILANDAPATPPVAQEPLPVRQVGRVEPEIIQELAVAPERPVAPVQEEKPTILPTKAPQKRPTRAKARPKSRSKGARAA